MDAFWLFTSFTGAYVSSSLSWTVTVQAGMVGLACLAGKGGPVCLTGLAGPT